MKDDGGPAFPQPLSTEFELPRIKDGGINSLAAGMSLRDYFAAEAMRGIFASGAMDTAAGMGVDPIENRNAAAFAAYDMADAMLAEREKGAK